MEIRKLSKIYISQKKVETKALDNVSFTFPEKGMFFILGKSGCGKTTLLNILGGIDTATEGQYTYFGNKLSSNKTILDNFRASEVSFVFQNYNLINELTVRDNLMLSNGVLNKDKLDDQIFSVLEKVKLSKDILKKYPTELSAGQQQRVALMRAFLKPHNVILADEPTGNLDSVTSKDIFDLLRNESKNKLVIIVTHDKESAQIYADEILRIEDGKLQNEKVKNVKSQKTVILCQKNIMKPSMVMKMVGINFKKKILMILLAFTLCVIAVSTISYSRAVGNFNIIDNTLQTFKENQITSCMLQISNKDANIDLIYKAYNKRKANYYKMVKYHNDNLPLYELFKGKGLDTIRFSIERGYVVIENEADIVNLFGKQNNNFNALDGVYLTDINAKLLIGSNYSTNMVDDKTIETEKDLINKYIRISNDRLYNQPYYVKVLGFIETDFQHCWDNYDNLQTKELEQFKYNITYKYFNYYGRDNYLNANLTPKDSLYQYNGDTIEVSSLDKNIKVDHLSSNFDNSYLIVGNKIVEKIKLQDNEIVVNLLLYNQIFGTNYLPSDLLDFTSMTLKKELDFTKKVNLKFGDKRTTDSIQDAKIVGVCVHPLIIDYISAITISKSLYESCNFYDNDTQYILIEDINLNELSELMELDSYQINAPYAHELRQYALRASELYKSYLEVSVVMTGFFLILMYYIINNIVRNNKKNIGILRSLGVSKRQCLDIFIIFAIQFSVFVIAAVSIIVPLWIHYSNIQIASSVLQGAVLLRYDILLILSLIGLPICAALLSSFIPLTKLSKRKPIDLINGG